ncbi:hypothetical protein KR054_011669 [Drosophila jambulina]|nr:hypothetical protein KR054_011669 [Drosophila jambulina]
MPGQYVNSRFSRPLMSLLRCFLSGLYLWAMLHAATIAITTHERWNLGLFWNTRLPDKLVYFDALSQLPGGEFCVLLVVTVVLWSIYIGCGCRLVGSQGAQRIGHKPPLEIIDICGIYMGGFLGGWIFGTYVTVQQVFLQRPSGTSLDHLYAQITMALLFKILILANMTSVWLRAIVRMGEFWVDCNRGNISSLNFGERLSLLFCN